MSTEAQGMFGALKRFMARFWLAKLFALLLAILLVVLIDRELRDTLFAEEVSLVSGEGITGNAISVSLPPGFVLLRESDAPLTARLRVRGRRKDKSRLQLPFRASIPDERLASIGTDRSEWVSLEAADLNTGELKDAEISFEQPVRIPVAREDEAELELRGVPAAPLADGVELAAEFTPARVWVRGPAPLLRKLNVLEIPLAAPQSEGGESREIKAVPAEVQKRGVRWADEAPRITAVVRLTSREADTLEVPNVRIVVLRSLKPAFDFNLEPPYELEHMNVTLTGPRTAIARLRDDAQLLQRLRSELIVLVPAERAAERERTPIAPGERRVLEVRASLPSEALAPYGVTLSDKRLVVPVAVTRLKRVP